MANLNVDESEVSFGIVVSMRKRVTDVKRFFTGLGARTVYRGGIFDINLKKHRSTARSLRKYLHPQEAPASMKQINLLSYGAH